MLTWSRGCEFCATDLLMWLRALGDCWKCGMTLGWVVGAYFLQMKLGRSWGSFVWKDCAKTTKASSFYRNLFVENILFPHFSFKFLIKASCAIAGSGTVDENHKTPRAIVMLHLLHNPRYKKVGWDNELELTLACSRFLVKNMSKHTFRSLFRFVTNAKCAKLFTSLECRWRKARNWTRNCYRVGNNLDESVDIWTRDVCWGCRLEYGGCWQSRG